MTYSKVAQWWSNRLLTGRLWVRAPPLEPIITHSEAGSSEELAEVVELADTRDLKSRDPYRSYRFDPGLRHQYFVNFDIAGWSSW